MLCYSFIHSNQGVYYHNDNFTCTTISEMCHLSFGTQITCDIPCRSGDIIYLLWVWDFQNKSQKGLVRKRLKLTFILMQPIAAALLSAVTLLLAVAVTLNSSGHRMVSSHLFTFPPVLLYWRYSWHPHQGSRYSQYVTTESMNEADTSTAHTHNWVCMCKH